MTAALGLLVISPENLKTLAIAVVLLTGFISAAVVLFPLTRAWANRLEGGTGGERVDELGARVSELETQLARLNEVEERLDFTERLLARQQGPRLTPGPREGDL
jgi:hypothetical protein